jgi:hypothetical protein
MPNHTGNGYFRDGNPGGPGRPTRQKEREYLDATIAAVPLARWRKIVRTAVADAEAGDHRARAWLSSILIGSDPPALRDLIDELRSRLEGLTREPQ